MKALIPLAVLLVAGSAVAADPTVNSAAVKGFATKAQPILANVCADCHARKDHPSPFKLKPTDPAYHDPQAADATLRAVAAQIDSANPPASPLLKSAPPPHGKPTDPPLKATAP